ncbi:hypothetical protein lerEdw1_008949, partial [Lerista edwardsae]
NYFKFSPILQAALSALKQFSEQGLDPVEGTMKVENGSLEKYVAFPEFFLWAYISIKMCNPGPYRSRSCINLSDKSSIWERTQTINRLTQAPPLLRTARIQRLSSRSFPAPAAATASL